ncbi:heterogeneous nuclear ribonucleoprotein U-like protein 1 isoform X3 [Drosophila navojoa]|uniref:heterogeneous nuclear ribonucleoprotein U-like protein 1 isoform X3 n=1 Tax=Drosophila navojoa TaxID=7232 RepID=UPI0011BDA1C8|nr:heterogeneous nuclear ribonucleoprotein U-like protein 1 isoform X3 [Drosophila navojoa]
MDLAKLDKMKVVDLRTELQTRGLDTKGVKAVLIERLRAHVEGSAAGGGDGDGAPVTPSRRQRRTRSMSRSPSPVAAAPVATQPELETLAEEEQHGAEPEAESASGAEVEEVEEDEQEEEQEQQETQPDDQAKQVAEEEEEEQTDSAAPSATQDEDVAMSEEPATMETENQEDSNDFNKPAEIATQEAENNDADADGDANADAENVAHQSNGNDGEKMDVDDDAGTGTKTDKEDDKQQQQEQEQEKSSERRKRSHSKTRSRSSSRSPKRRSGDKRDSKGGAAVEEQRTVAEDEPTIEENKVGLSWFDSDIHLVIDSTNFTSAKPLAPEIYSLIWSGARANYGVREGKVCFEVQLSEEIVPENAHHFRDEPHVRGFRVGFSTPQSSLLLGEAEHSYGYCESGRKANNGEFKDYGKPYQLDDVIGCYLDLESTPCNIRYTLNGEDLGIAHEFEKSSLGEDGALFPHIVTKGYEYTVNFSNAEELLVNAERPTRKRRKQRAESHKDDDNDGEKWKVLDEATADDDEPEKKDDEAKPAAGEEDGDKVAEAETEPEANADASSKPTEDEQSKEAGGEGESQSEQAEQAEGAEAASQDQAMEPAEEAAEATAAVPTESAAVTNGDSVPDAEAAAEPEAAAKESAKSNEASANAEDEDEDGPSPNKRTKTESETEKSAEKSQAAEEEYEDVVPVPRDTVALLPGYVLLALVPIEQLVPGPQRPASRKECEVILLVGLPGAGKTHWTLKHVAENADKRYEVIGPDSIIAKMTIDGESRKTVHKGRWDKVYEICLNSLGGLEDIAMKRRRNFILDQPISRCPRWSLAGLTTSSTRS